MSRPVLVLPRTCGVSMAFITTVRNNRCSLLSTPLRACAEGYRLIPSHLRNSFDNVTIVLIMQMRKLRIREDK